MSRSKGELTQRDPHHYGGLVEQLRRPDSWELRINVVNIVAQATKKEAKEAERAGANGAESASRVAMALGQASIALVDLARQTRQYGGLR